VSEQVRVPRAIAQEIVAHCLEGRPNEACGVLGSAGGDLVKVFG
jgi:hypothetical protein